MTEEMKETYRKSAEQIIEQDGSCQGIECGSCYGGILVDCGDSGKHTEMSKEFLARLENGEFDDLPEEIKEAEEAEEIKIEGKTDIILPEPETVPPLKPAEKPYKTISENLSVGSLATIHINYIQRSFEVARNTNIIFDDEFSAHIEEYKQDARDLLTALEVVEQKIKEYNEKGE